jgi:uncharacterized membrane protein required for colicin V production
MAFDVVLIGLLTVGFLVGFFRGVIRALLAMGAWLVCFVFAAYLRVPLGEWLARSATFSSAYADLVAFGVIFFALFTTLILVIVLSRAPTEWTRHAVIDDILGGVVGVIVVGLVIASAVVMLDHYYAVANPAPGVDVGWPADMNRALVGSTIAGWIGDTGVSVIGFLLGPVLPEDIRAVML